MTACSASRFVVSGVLIVLGSIGSAVGPAFAAESLGAEVDSLRAVMRAGHYADAERRARARLVTFQPADSVESLFVSRMHLLLAEAIRRGGRPNDPEAERSYRISIDVRERVQGLDHPDLIPALDLYGVLLSARGEFDKSKAMLGRAIALAEKNFGPEHFNVARALIDLGVVYEEMGDYNAALATQERVRAIYERTLGPEHQDVSLVLHNLANVRVLMGDLSLARSLEERSLMLLQRGVGREHPEVAITLGNLGTILRGMGDFRAARDTLEAALAIKQRVMGATNPSVGMSYLSLGALLANQGDLARARPLIEHALAIHEQSLGADHQQVGSDLFDLASLLDQSGENTAARPVYRRSIAVFEKSLGPEHPSLAFALEGLGSLELEDGNVSAADSLCRRAFAIRGKALGPDHPDNARSLFNLANVRGREGRAAEAESLSTRAVAIWTRALGPDHPDVAQALLQRATLEAERGAMAEALDHALEAERIGREHLRLTSRSLAEREALRYSATRASGLDLLLTLAAKGIGSAETRRVFDAVVRSRAVVLDEMASRRRSLSASGDSVSAKREAVLIAARERLANLVVRGPGSETVERNRAQLDRARAATEEAERELTRSSAMFSREVVGKRIGLDEVDRALPAGSALVAFAQYRKKPIDAHGPGSRPDMPCYLAFVLPAVGQSPQVVDLGPANLIDHEVGEWKREAGGGSLVVGAPARVAEESYRETGASLRKRVWDPLQPSMAGTGRVFIVPDGTLNLVSFASLPNDAGGYLVESGPLLHYLSAERDLASGAEPRRGRGLLAAGAPNYDDGTLFAVLSPDAAKAGQPQAATAAASGTVTPYRGARSACRAFGTLQFEPLRATGTEVRELVRQWQRGRKGGPRGDGDALCLEGAAASETEVKAASPGRRVLHLATHGFFLAGQCEPALDGTRGTGGLSATNGVPPDTLGPAVGDESPLMRSGLVFAGANRRASAGSGEDDGILTAEEIASLDLSGVEWAVLSACETGVGDIRAGEGVFGLRRAFQVAGAGTLIMSLWSVEDQATLSWMKALYVARLKDHQDTATAARRASLQVLRERRAHKLSTHPFYWAAFVTAGDWR